MGTAINAAFCVVTAATAPITEATMDKYSATSNQP